MLRSQNSIYNISASLVLVNVCVVVDVVVSGVQQDAP